ncbi:ubiquitin-protein ligase [Chloropicon primus]|uniref:HECT-type E3 ubiquitin transferase n=1 Tax=Chloropicon primus TaxID=1764295 RepID=A0A5B8MVA6_9CHLO|nr:ubiquitin-protein ligase [Chloropicon primus]UPR02787.1 ubiquitin-protein ligase [Chloropicon primus]|eukprot:QDZ23575.1 ubiquitin-protein ligase [Chloropicon primus]
MGCFSCFGASGREEHQERVNQRGASTSDKLRDKQGLGSVRGKRLLEDLTKGLDRDKDGVLIGILAACDRGKTLKDLGCALESARVKLKDKSVSGDEARARKRVLVLHRCLDVAWRDLLDALEAGTTRGTLDWGAVSIKGIQDHLEQKLPEVLRKDMCYCTSLALEVLQFFYELNGPKSPSTEGVVRLEDGLFHNESISFFMNYISVILNRSVTQLSCADMEKQKREFGEVLCMLGLGVNLVYALDSASVSTLVYLMLNTEEDESKLSLRVVRDRPFQSGFTDFSHQVFRGVFEHPDVRGPRCKIFPLFVESGVEENGGTSVAFEKGEGHGPRKEFFDLVSQELTAKGGRGSPLLFAFSRSMGKFWFNLGVKRTEEVKERYYFVGWLMAQAFFNRTNLSVDFSEVIFERLLKGEGFVPSMEYLEAMDPEAAKSIQNINKLPQGDFESMLVLEGKKGMSRKDFIEDSVKSVLLDGVKWQFDALCRGFHSILTPEKLVGYFSSAASLQMAICGKESMKNLENFSVREVFLVNYDEELEEQWPLLSNALWEVLDSWPKDKKLCFVKFVTGSDRLPLPNTELIKIELPFFAFSDHDHKNLLKTLPQAHTCENLLEIPNYWESLLHVKGTPDNFWNLGQGEKDELLKELRETMDDRLTFAVSNCDTYGLDTLEEGAGGGELPMSLDPSSPIKMGGNEAIAPNGSPMKPAIAVTNDEIEFLTVYQEAEEADKLSLPSLGGTPVKDKALALPAQNGESPKPATIEKKPLHDKSIDEMVNELGIEL